MFRRVGVTPLASELIRMAVTQLTSKWADYDLYLDNAGPVSTLITGIDSRKTASRRSRNSSPGKCFLEAGWTPIDRITQRADTWLEHPWQNPFCGDN
jgi:hypothetical protein